MKRPTLLEGATFSLLASLASSILLTTLTGILPGGVVFRLVLASCGFAYVIYLLGRSSERVGRVVVITAWFGISATAWWLSLPMPLYVLLHLVLVWLVRSLYHHSSLLPALADLGLLGVGLAMAFWAFAHTGNTFLAVWCFFLLQSLFVLIPSNPVPKRATHRLPSKDEERFERAHRNAITALRGIHSIH